jgi:uracil-DNA glycosylase family 4
MVAVVAPDYHHGCWNPVHNARRSTDTVSRRRFATRDARRCLRHRLRSRASPGIHDPAPSDSPFIVDVIPVTASAADRRDQLKEVFREASVCTRCPLAETRTTVVFGAGNADADLMFVGEAPGANEDKQGLPFVGQAGKLLDKLLGEIGLDRGEVFIANVLKCRPPGNRDPHPVEIDSCRDYLHRQVELIEPRVICTLGNFATKLLRGDPTGISRLHGQPEIHTIGMRAVRVYPLYHPAAALYTPSMLETLRTDFARLPELLAQPAPPQPEGVEPIPEPAEPVEPVEAAEAAAPEWATAARDDQLGLFE